MKKPESNGDGAKWRMAGVIAAVFGALLAVLSPTVLVVWTLAQLRQDQALGLVELKSSLSTGWADQLREMERRQDDKYVSKEYLKLELERALAVDQLRRIADDRKAGG